MCQCGCGRIFTKHPQTQNKYYSAKCMWNDRYKKMEKRNENKINFN